MKKVVGKLKKNPGLVFLILFLVWFTLAWFVKWDYGDDPGFLETKIWDLSRVLPERYTNWTSRVIIETFVAVFATLPRVFWCGFVAGSITFITRSISYLLTKDDFRDKVISAVAMGIFPYIIMFTAGWFNTSIFYLLPMVCMMVAFYPVKWINEWEKMRWWQVVISLVATVVACNWEQTLAIMMGFLLVFIVKFWKEGKKNWVLIAQMMIAVASAVFILTCPGNVARSEVELSWFPGYEGFLIWQKLMLGINGTMSVMMYRDNIVLMTLFVMIAVALWKHKEKWVRMISKMPLTVYVAVFLMHHVASKMWGGVIELKVYSNIVGFNGIRPNLDFSVRNIVLMIIVLGVIGCVLVSLWEIFKESAEERRLMPLIFMAGYLSVVMVAFSPTFYGSNVRIYAFLDLAMIILVVMIMRKLKNKGEGIGRAVICIACALQVAVQILAIFFGRMYTI